MPCDLADATVEIERRPEMPTSTMALDACELVDARVRSLQRQRVTVYTIELPDYPFGCETFAQREHAERYLEELRRLDPELPSSVRIEKHVLEASGIN
jgi:hypothetical protein